VFSGMNRAVISSDQVQINADQGIGALDFYYEERQGAFAFSAGIKSKLEE
jgi:hypothetical protein